MGNPVGLVDPDGRATKDIIIRAKRGDETNYKARTFEQLQSLTDDVLGFAPDGKTVIIIEQRSGDKTEGTGLYSAASGFRGLSPLKHPYITRVEAIGFILKPFAFEYS